MGGGALNERGHTIPAAYAIPLLELGKGCGIDEAQLLGAHRIDRDRLIDPHETLPFDVAVALFEKAIALTGEPALGIYFGLQMRASAHGILGFAAMSAGTVRDAI